MSRLSNDVRGGPIEKKFNLPIWTSIRFLVVLFIKLVKSCELLLNYDKSTDAAWHFTRSWGGGAQLRRPSQSLSLQ